MIRHLLLGMAGFAIGSVTVYNATADNLETFRTTGMFAGLTQGTNKVGKFVYKNASFNGHNLVNLAMGRSLNDTNFPQQVLALTLDCELSSANLVVYDESVSNIVAGIGSSSVIDVVKQQDSKKALGPNRAQFVTMLNVFQTGNGNNALLGGYLTVAGRLNLDPTNGCPQPVLVLDRDPFDLVDAALPRGVDTDNGPDYNTGQAHLIGDVMIVTGGETETVLLPFGDLNIRRELPIVVPTQTD